MQTLRDRSEWGSSEVCMGGAAWPQRRRPPFTRAQAWLSAIPASLLIASVSHMLCGHAWGDGEGAALAAWGNGASGPATAPCCMCSTCGATKGSAELWKYSHGGSHGVRWREGRNERMNERKHKADDVLLRKTESVALRGVQGPLGLCRKRSGGCVGWGRVSGDKSVMMGWQRRGAGAPPQC